MKRILLFLLLLLTQVNLNAQTNPAITNWLINTSNIKGRHYVKGNSTPIADNVLANVQTVQYSTNYVYVTTHGIPAYITGPFQDGNPSLASDQNAIFKIPLNPVINNGTPTNTTGGNIGIFINGVALFDYRDGVSWQNSTNSLKGGPLMGVGDNVWNRDAIVGEKLGFDCSKAHPAMGNYHHHQNPSAFSLDLKVISSVCDLYASDGLYAIDSTKHSPLIGFAYDGYPIYGAFAFQNANGTGAISRMKSSYSLRSITTRTQYANGSTVTAGPNVNTTYPLGYFREDYQYNNTSSSTPDYLDEHNGRFCITPEYPAGIYCYFATVDANWNSAYPYVVGPTFFGVKSAIKVNSITETVTNYSPKTAVLTLSETSIHLTAKDSLTKTIVLTSNTNWKAISNQKWLKLSADSGNGSVNLILTSEVNNTSTSRFAIVTISGTGILNQYIAVTQDGQGLYINVTPKEINFLSSSSGTYFSLDANTSWNLTYNQNWIKFDKVSGINSGTVYINCDDNTFTQVRYDTISINGTGVNVQKIFVKQMGTSPFINLNKLVYYIPFNATSNNQMEIVSNTNWDINNSNTWIKLSKKSGFGNDTITFSSTENSSTLSRGGFIHFNGSFQSSTITIIQAGKIPSDVENVDKNKLDITLFPNPTSDLIAIQSNNIIDENIVIELFDINGKFIQKTDLFQGSTIAFFDTKTLYSGEYIIKFTKSYEVISKRVILNK